MTLRAISDELAQAKSKKKEFLSQIGRMIPWAEWVALIKPHYVREVEACNTHMARYRMWASFFVRLL